MSAMAEMRQEALELEALLISRSYLYELFYKVLGGTPDEALLAILFDETTRDVVEEFAGDNPSMIGWGRFLEHLGTCVDRSLLLDQARDEYTRLFIGPGALPCAITESPYLTGDRTEFQENTLAVRRIYRRQGLELGRLMRVPDDHIATMCAYMALQAERSRRLFRECSLEELASSLRDQSAFATGHMLTWVDRFAHCARRSKTAVLYPQLIEALAAFVHNDETFLSEAALWAEQLSGIRGASEGAEGQEDRAVLLSLTTSIQSLGKLEAFREVERLLATLRKIRPYGIEDHELVERDERSTGVSR